MRDRWSASASWFCSACESEVARKLGAARATVEAAKTIPTSIGIKLRML